MNDRPVEDFIALVEGRITNKNYDELFSGGCCFHFALRSFRRGIGSLAYIQSSYDRTKMGHAFVLVNGKDGLAFDHKGYRDVSTIKKEFGCWPDEQHFVSNEAEIERKAAERALPDSLSEKVFAIADQIISEKLTPPA